MSNTLIINDFSLPKFSNINYSNIFNSLQEAIDNCNKTIENVIYKNNCKFNWNNLCQPIADSDNNLSSIFSIISHLNAVKNCKELRKVYEKSFKLIYKYRTFVGHNKELYKAYINIRDSDYYYQLSVPKKKYIDNVLRDFKFSGIGLSEKKQKIYGYIVARLSKLSIIYSNNVLDSTIGWSKLIIDKNELSGMPDNALEAARDKAKICGKDGWLLTLDIQSYFYVMNYCNNSSIRKELYIAYITRASNKGPNAGKWDNGKIIEEILLLRYKLSKILGFDNYANKSLSKKMANNPKKVIKFLNYLVKFTISKGKKDLKILKNFTKLNFGIENIYPWDIYFYSEKQKNNIFDINYEKLIQYFPENKVVSGLFIILNRIYGITIKNRTKYVDTWHPDVQFFDVFDEIGELRGSFYIDLYIRDNKRSGAWMDEFKSMMIKSNGVLQKPVVYITCNFQRPINGKQALFTHNDVITLFHEFGHSMHHILTCIDTPGVSGISGVPWDAVELPSQFMENYCWQPEALKLISCHYETGKKISKKILKNLLKLKNYQVSLFILRQLELSIFDLFLHYEYKPKNRDHVLKILSKVQKKVKLLPIIDCNFFQNSFNHIFDGGYAAGYYSYLWAEVLAADVWSRFEEDGIFNYETGKEFINKILSRGGSEDPIVLFSRFRGRKPKLDIMLRNYGIIHKKDIYL